MEPIPPKDCNRYNRLRLCVDPARLPPPNLVPPPPSSKMFIFQARGITRLFKIIILHVNFIYAKAFTYNYSKRSPQGRGHPQLNQIKTLDYVL